MTTKAALFGSLTTNIANKTSPLRAHFETCFPNRAPLQATYRAGAGPILVPGGDANPGTLGAAFDFAIRMVLDPAHRPDVAFAGFGPASRAMPVIIEVVRTAQAAAAHDPAAGDDLFRACWVLALCTEVFRAGLRPGTPLADAIRDGRFTHDGLMALASEDALGQMRALHAVAVPHLLAHLPARPARLDLGPTFDGSVLLPADADLIVDGLLLDLKTRLGALNKTTGTRADTVSVADLYQLLGYTLFDHSDTFAISAVGIYSGRYGNLTTWGLGEFLNTLAGTDVNLTVEREHVWAILGGS
ncbi:hypothetical protein [Tessaracoccus sp.]